jgi:hypothetical protein
VLEHLVAFAVQAGSEEEPSKVAFYVLGGLFAAWAVLLGALGITRHSTFPASAGATRAVMGISVVLMVGALGSAVLTS